MTAPIIAALLAQFGPSAITLIRELIALWKKPVLTPAEVDALLALAEKSYDAYIAEAQAKQP